MKALAGSITFVLLITLWTPGCGDSRPELSGDQVVVHTANLDVTFTSLRPFSGSYMVFGGTTLNQRDAFYRVSLAGLEVGVARQIYNRYPDFDRCSSRGAPAAQQAITQLDIVPAGGGIARTLKKALSLNAKKTQGVPGKTCVTLAGRVLRLRSAVVRELDEDITSQLPQQVHHDYFLIESATVTTFKEILTASLP